MGVSYDDYIRTTEQRHKVSSAELWRRIEASGDIYLGITKAGMRFETRLFTTKPN